MPAGHAHAAQHGIEHRSRIALVDACDVLPAADGPESNGRDGSAQRQKVSERY